MDIPLGPSHNHQNNPPFPKLRRIAKEGRFVNDVQNCFIQLFSSARYSEVLTSDSSLINNIWRTRRESSKDPNYFLMKPELYIAC